MISITIPTYNERKNIKELVHNIHAVLHEYDYELIIVDDNSPDGTADVAEELSKNYPIRILKREGKLGLASAILYGFQNSKGKILGVIDADLQHPPEYMKKFIRATKEEYDIVIGSRYVDGGKIENWSKYRTLISKGAILLSRPLTTVKDPTSGYFFIKKNVINGISLSPIGYKMLLEILVKCSYERVVEIPYTFKSRQNGHSKLKNGEYINYLKLLYHLYMFKLNRFIKNGNHENKTYCSENEHEQ